MVRSSIVKRMASARSFSVLRMLRQATPVTTTGDKQVVLETEVPGFREPGQIPTNYEIASGLERYEHLKRLKGEDPWEDLHPIVITQKGTPKNPIHVSGVDSERYVGCTGFPADSHEAIWLTVRDHGNVDRCPHCGNCFKYTQQSSHHH